jgi:outer membrane protein OmpA-like peptidoglycan-associated protein
MINPLGLFSLLLWHKDLNHMRHILYVFVLSVLSVSAAHAQDEAPQGTSSTGLPQPRDFDRWSVGATVGISHLFSDLLYGDGSSNSRYLQQGLFPLAIGVQGGYQFTHSVGLRARGLVTRFEGYDEEFIDAVNPNTGAIYKKRIGVKFSSPVKEGSLEMVYNFGNISFLNRNKHFHLVATLGAGVFNFDTDVKLDSAQSELLRSSGKVTEFMIPFSFGFRYNVNRVSAGLSVEYRKTFTDDADATYKSFSETDNYAMVTVGVNYTLGKKNKPMEWVNPMEVVYNDLADMKEKVDIISGDKDKDGISDLFDKDNNTPEGAKVYGDGTPVDTDGDGIIDMKDADPFTPKGAKVDGNGMELDSDADGVADSRDLEPNTAQGSLVNFQGMTVAAPGQYRSPGDAGSGGSGKDGLAGSSGTLNAGAGSTGYLPSVFFESGSAEISTKYHDRLLTVARAMMANPNLRIRITGNCDVNGGSSENMRLGQRRADGVRQHLVTKYGIEGDRIRTESKGKSNPIANGLNSMNRRVDFVIE